MALRTCAAGLRAVHRRHRERVAAVIRRFAQALVAVAVLLILIAEVQLADDAADARARAEFYAGGRP